MATFQSSKGEGVYLLDAGDRLGVGSSAVSLVLLRGGKFYGLDVVPLEDQEGLLKMMKDPRVRVKKLV